MAIHEILQKYWGYSEFRPLQEDIINSILHKKDTLALLPTGGGKSICFQVPALALEGVCIVISPLIALMKDQVFQLKSRGISAGTIVSGMTKREIDIELDNCIYGKTKFLYISPERLETTILQERIKKMSVAFLAVDEAHCISQWGYDFRPSYLKISNIRELLPKNTPIMALTASATQEVVDDIQEKLAFKTKNVFRKSFERENLAYTVFKEENKQARLLKIATKFKGTGVIYVRNRRKTKEISDLLNKNKIKADYYHAGLSMEDRDKKQKQWINNTIRIIVSTNAFGMGIDKPDVRFVLHIDLPDSLEAYYQEAGRGGRDGKRAYAIVLYDSLDIKQLNDKIKENFPEINEIKRVYQALANYFHLAIGSAKDQSFDFDIKDFCKQYNLIPNNTINCLKILENEEYIYLTDSFLNPSRIHFEMDKSSLYDFQVRNSKYDEFIKLLLRSYSGCFDNYVAINEKDIAKRLESNLDEVRSVLKVLHKHNVLSYLPQNTNPKVTYLSERIDSKNLYINTTNLKARKNVIIGQLNSVISYTQNKSLCRSKIILDYFNETNTNECGSCDICLGNVDNYTIKYKEIEKLLLLELSDKPIKLEVLVQKLQKNEDQILKCIQWLLDSKRIFKNQSQELFLNK